MQEAGRWIKTDSGVGICPGQMHTKVGYLGRRKLLSYGRSGLVLDLGCLLENGNFKKFSQYFLSKLSFDKLSWVFCILRYKFFLDFCQNGFFTSGNPCDSSPPPRRNHEPGTLEKFSKHGFSFFNPNIPLSLETRTKWKFGCLFHDNPHLSSKNPFWQNSKNFPKAKCKNPT